MKKVLQISLNDGSIIKTWDSSYEASAALKGSSQRIMRVCQGKLNKSIGFFWIYENIELQKQYKVFQKDYINKKEVKRENRKGVVVVDNITFDIIKSYESREKMAAELNTYPSKIKFAIRNGLSFGDKLIFDEKNYVNNRQDLHINYINNPEVCKICNLRFRNLESFSTHIQYVHKITCEDYTIKYILDLTSQPMCKVLDCNNITRYATYCFKDYCGEHAYIAMSENCKKIGALPAWNKGLTKEDHPTLMEYSNRMSGTGNPMSGVTHSKETIESTAAKLRLSESEILNYFDKRSNDFTFPNFDYVNYKNCSSKIECKCNICGNICIKPLIYLIKGRLCKICYPNISQGHKGISDFIRCDLGINNIIDNDRTIVYPKELDIVLPDFKFAIEYNGIHWHKQENEDDIKNRNNHNFKTITSLGKGYELFHIFSDEWLMKPDIIKSMIRDKLRLNTVDNININECLLKQIDSLDECKSFYDSNHIDGFSPKLESTNKHYGLYSIDNKLLSLMSISEMLTETSSGPSKDLYIIDHVVKQDKNRQTYFNRMIDCVKLLYQDYTSIYIEVDTRNDKTSLYEDIGFKLETELGTKYWYTDEKIRYDSDVYEEAFANEIESADCFKIYGCDVLLYSLDILEDKSILIEYINTDSNLINTIKLQKL